MKGPEHTYISANSQFFSTYIHAVSEKHSNESEVIEITCVRWP